MSLIVLIWRILTLLMIVFLVGRTLFLEIGDPKALHSMLIAIMLLIILK